MLKTIKEYLKAGWKEIELDIQSEKKLFLFKILVEIQPGPTKSMKTYSFRLINKKSEIFHQEVYLELNTMLNALERSINNKIKDFKLIEDEKNKEKLIEDDFIRKVIIELNEFDLNGKTRKFISLKNLQNEIIFISKTQTIKTGSKEIVLLEYIKENWKHLKNIDLSNLGTNKKRKKIKFQWVTLENISFKNSNLKNLWFYNCNLKNVDFSNSNLEQSIFEFSIFNKCNFNNANLYNSDWSSIHFYDCFTQEELFEKEITMNSVFYSNTK